VLLCHSDGQALCGALDPPPPTQDPRPLTSLEFKTSHLKGPRLRPHRLHSSVGSRRGAPGLSRPHLLWPPRGGGGIRGRVALGTPQHQHGCLGLDLVCWWGSAVVGIVALRFQASLYIKLETAQLSPSGVQKDTKNLDNDNGSGPSLWRLSPQSFRVYSVLLSERSAVFIERSVGGHCK